MPAENNDCRTMKVIMESLELAGDKSKQVILSYMQEKYGMDLDALARYRDEFANYLGEILGDSADIIMARIDRVLDEHDAALARNPLCYVCNLSLASEKMHQHLLHDHTKEEIAYHLAVIFVDDWREEAESRDENDSALRQLLHN